MAVNDTDKLHLLFVVGEQLQKLLQTLPEQPTDYKSHIEMFDEHLKASRYNALELYEWFNTEWSPDMYFADFETKCREKTLHYDFPITLDNAIIMMTVVKTSNVELRNEIIRKNGDLKLVRETVKAFEIASEGSQMMKSGKEVNSQDTGNPELKRISIPGRFSMGNKRPSHTPDPSQAQARPSCTKCWNEAHVNKNTCRATGRRCLKCGRLNHFACVCKGAANDRKDKRANAVECEQQTNTHSVSQEENFLEDVYLYQLKKGKSQNPTVAVHINDIVISLNLDTQADVMVVTEKHYGKLKANYPLQETSITIRSYSGEGKGLLLPVLGKFTATVTRGEKEIAEPMYVVKGQGDIVPLSRGAAERMGLVEYQLDLISSTPLPVMGETRQETVDLVEEYKDVFSG